MRNLLSDSDIIKMREELEIEKKLKHSISIALIEAANDLLIDTVFEEQIINLDNVIFTGGH